jgi:hypothetical protein
MPASKHMDYVYYRADHDRWFAMSNENGKPISVGPERMTENEAIRDRVLHKNGKEHHWEGADKEKQEKSFGFIYRITNRLNGRLYLGSKQLYYWDGPRGGYKCTDPTSPLFDRKAWKPGEWEFYTSSSEELNKDIQVLGAHNFRFQILCYAPTRLQLHMEEITRQIMENVLEARTEDGATYLYYNKNIARMEFRPDYFPEDAMEQREQEMEEVRQYYLKPEVCTSCNRILPYKTIQCACGKKEESNEFEDLR